jgi:lysophospholipase L1-like esterase
VSRASRARRIATAAAYGGGGLGVLGALGGAALYGLLISQTKLARRRIPRPEAAPPLGNDTTWIADGVPAEELPVHVALLGDSTAAGYGVHRTLDTPGVRLALEISAAARRPVLLSNVAVVGAESGGLAAQLQRLGRRPVDLAVVMIGANDVTHRVKPADSVRHLRAAVTALRAQGAEVVVGTCPDLGTIRPISQPLRTLARRLSRNLAAAQTIAVVAEGGRTVSLGDLLGPLFAHRRELFSDDQFHPSAAGYAAAVDAVLPSALDVLGLRTESEPATAFRTGRARPIARAAARAVAVPGTEVAGAPMAHRIGRGPWAVLRRRRTRPPLGTGTPGADGRTGVPARESTSTTPHSAIQE